MIPEFHWKVFQNSSNSVLSLTECERQYDHFLFEFGENWANPFAQNAIFIVDWYGLWKRIEDKDLLEVKTELASTIIEWVLDDCSWMLTAISFYAFLTQLVSLVVSLPVYSRRNLQEQLPLRVRCDELIEGEKLRFYLIERGIVFQDFLNDYWGTSHMKSVMSFRTIFSLCDWRVISRKRSIRPMVR